MYPAFCVSIFFAIIRSIVCEDECGPPHEVDRAQISNPSDTDYAVGSTITYKCDYGFVIGGAVKTSRCVIDPATNEPVWTEPQFACNPRSCGDPGVVENARRIGSRFTFPNNVEYACDEGYTLSGLPRRYCEASGAWSGRLPSCRAISCGRPEDPDNGRAVYTSLTYNSELRYDCNRDLQLSPKESRFCGPDGKWTGVKPICREVECEMPSKPEFGTVELFGNKPKVGSIVNYKCDPGLRLVGSSNSKCLKSGEWTFPTPLCVEPCVVPFVANGELGKNEEEYTRRIGWRTVFKVVPEGTTLDENEQVTLKCNTNYVPKSQPLREITITCQRGQLTPEPECVSTMCLDDPPSIENGKAVVSNRHHGYVMWYKCDNGFEKGTPGRIECSHGSWTGYPPVCKDTRCDKSSLNYPGLVRDEGFIFNKASFVPTCLSGYDVTENSDKKIYCREGSWSGNLPPCTVAQCRTEDLVGFSGLVLQGSHNLDDGEWFRPMCTAGFEFYNKQDSRVYCRGGVWQGNIPPCSPAHCSNKPPVPENGKIKSFRTSDHGSFVEYECFPLYEMDGRGNVVCNHGQWTGSPPTCKNTRCYLRNLHEKEGVDLTNDNPVYSSTRKANIACIRGYNLRYPEVYCENGVWNTENVLSPCQEDDCEVKQVGHGKILKEKSVTVKYYLGFATRKETVRERADIGSSESSGAVLYVECNGQYRFQGEETEKQVAITCRRGEWTPIPVCLLPGKPLQTESPNAGEEDAIGPPATLPTSEFSKMNDSAIKTLETNHSTRISGQWPFSVNNSVEENPDGASVMLEGNSTENEELITTNIPSCSCNYIVKDSNLIAHDGKKVIKYGDDILSGSVIQFYCNTTGFWRLRGVSSLICPPDCNWHSSMFPSCVYPNNDDVIISVFANPRANMKVGPGGVLSVVPGTRLELTCRVAATEYRVVDWIVPVNDGVKQRGVTMNGLFKMQYTVMTASPRNSGTYSCYKEGGTKVHAVEIKVGDIICPEIQVTEDLVVSYAPDRKYGGQATFHCFSPYMRNGPSYVTCESSGFWSGPPASCYLPTCSVESLYDIIAEGVVPLIEGNIGDNVQFGYEQRLGCDEEGRVIKGDSTALCSTDGKWRVGNDLECVQGCVVLPKKNGSELVISPNKEFYGMGESVTFSCPQGKALTIDVQRILCFSNGWTPNTIPDCH